MIGTPQIATTNTSEENQENTIDNTTKEDSEDKTPTDTNINMAFTGDIMCHNTVYNDAFDTASRNI